MTSSQLKKFADVQEGPRHGHFVMSKNALKRYVSARAEAEVFDPAQVPTPGKKFIVYRVGGKDEVSLRGRNAGNADGVAAFIAKQEEYEGSSTGNLEHDPHIHAYEVTVNKPFGGYSALQRGMGGAGSKVGRSVSGGKGHYDRERYAGEALYSFPLNGFTEKHLGAIPLAKVERLIKGQSRAEWAADEAKSFAKYHVEGPPYEPGRPGSFLAAPSLTHGGNAIREAFGHTGWRRRDESAGGEE